MAHRPWPIDHGKLLMGHGPSSRYQQHTRECAWVACLAVKCAGEAWRAPASPASASPMKMSSTSSAMSSQSSCSTASTYRPRIPPHTRPQSSPRRAGGAPKGRQGMHSSSVRIGLSVPPVGGQGREAQGRRAHGRGAQGSGGSGPGPSPAGSPPARSPGAAPQTHPPSPAPRTSWLLPQWPTEQHHAHEKGHHARPDARR